MKLSMSKHITRVIILIITCGSMLGCASMQKKHEDSHKTLLKAIVISMGSDGSMVTDAQYDAYFKQGSAKEGVNAVIATGKFSINGYPIPATEEEATKTYPNGFLVNQVPWLYYDTSKGGWVGGYKGQKSAMSYQAAALAVATGIVAGLEVRLYDTNNDGFTDLIEADYKEGVAVEKVTHNSDGSYSVFRGDIKTINKTSSEGRIFDGDNFTATSGERIKPENFDTALAEGDVALFWYGIDGWNVQRAREVNGIFTDGSDHHSYTIDEKAYGDAMRFSRDNLPISNRPGEYANTQKYFGLNDNREEFKVSLWLVPTTDSTAQGAPIAITSNRNARAFLDKAITIASTSLAAVTVSTDGKNVTTGNKWVTPNAYAKLHDAISRGKAILSDATSSSALVDYQVYLLYLTLNGSQDDIGARFGGFDYSGFNNEIKVKK